jgi:hypothetical protein
MLIGSQQRLDKIFETPNILYGEHQIKRVRKKTVLGLIIDDQLKRNITLLRKAKDFITH